MGINERSAGGLVLRNGKILMVRVKNLEGQTVWTFPKGHLENGENHIDAALREVREETGWECKVMRSTRRPKGKFSHLPFKIVYYQFKKFGKPVHKEVVWYRMHPVLRVQKRDEEEILRVRWYSFRKARDIVTYKSDKILLEKIGSNDKKEKLRKITKRGIKLGENSLHQQ